ncbi:disrupted in renal carcinoma protein 2-like [Mizuhopecten yessoensis]|uniref:Disrupted in renal carcinoma protein 2-like n=1 Tax=Mizuhopecten yessoensis TaxID=6573 RepID=A0A210QQX9_MIZYE|nr:disrupted in renal carcinoma protein 2-like [Mizuhopecten yessoensis]OWF51146.1 Disrupted in renal carcinoma protein 2-like [Mizuhopecten yessoensis]
METPTKRLLDNADSYGTFPEYSVDVDSVGHVINQDGTDSPHLPNVNAEITVGVRTHVYKRRWYVLVVFSLVAAIQGGYWNTWGPIAASTEEAFGWDDADIALLSNWGPIAYLISAVFFGWLIDVKGIRLSVLIAIFLVAVGAGFRCITSEPPYVKWTVHTGQLLNGLGGPVAMGLPPVLSATWFPPHERTTATAISQILNGLGVGVSFIIGPYLVPDKPPDNSNSSLQNISYSTTTGPNTTDVSARISNERSEIMFLLYIEFGFAALIFLLTLVYFPDKPTLPPSTTASIERLEFKKGLLQLVRNFKFWMVCLTYGVSLGVFNCWQSVLDVNLKPHGISENEAGWLGFYSTLAASFTCITVARFSDIFSKHMRLFLVILYIGGALAMAWFAVLVNGYIPNSTTSLYISIILGTLLLNATPPLYYEMACEITYPVAEGISNLWLTMINNVGGLIFLLIQMIPNIGTTWENWCVLGAVVICIPVLCTMDERYNRLEVDEQSNKK